MGKPPANTSAMSKRSRGQNGKIIAAREQINRNGQLGLNAQQRAAQALEMYEMRLGGIPWYEIAARYGVSQDTVFKRFQLARSLRPSLPPDQMREFEADRLDRQLVELEKVINDDRTHNRDRVSAIAALRQVTEVRAKLFNLNITAPIEVNLNHKTSDVATEIQLLAEQLGITDTADATHPQDAYPDAPDVIDAEVISETETLTP